MDRAKKRAAHFRRRAVALALALTGLAAVPATAQPHPGSEGVETLGNWALVCDNMLGCQMSSLLPPETGEERPDLLQMAVRTYGDIVQPEVLVRVPLEQGGWRIEIDGVQVAQVATLRGTEWRIGGVTAWTLIRRMQSGRQAVLRDAAGRFAGEASLTGVTAGLMAIDDVQGRQGTVAGLSLGLQRRWRPRPITRPDIPVPTRSSAPPAALVQPPFDPSCRNNGERAQRTVVRLDAEMTLMLVPHPCTSGAYNLMVSAFVADNDGRQRPALFDSDAGLDGDGDNPVLTNARWDPVAHRLETVSLARGIGDCGTRNRFVWDGQRFRLVFRAVMPECRGSYLWLPVWRAVVREGQTSR